MTTAAGTCPSHGAVPRRPTLEVATIFRRWGADFRTQRPTTHRQRRVMWAIEHCRTSTLGGHVDECDQCGLRRISYNSCRDRHCPGCQSLRQARWIGQRKQRILPVPHFHVVFTLPAQLRTLALTNPEPVYAHLMRAAAQTLLAFGHDERWLGGQLGLTCVLHTWRRDLAFHPHVHCVVTAGGLARDGSRWVPARGLKNDFLFPVHALAKVFRGKLIAALNVERAAGRLSFRGRCEELACDARWKTLLSDLRAKPWVVYSKRAFASAEHVYEYLGRYSHRVAISGQRLVAVTDRAVRLRTRGDRTVELAPMEFIRRFLLHVLPHRFVKIRHYGLLAPASISCGRHDRARTLASSGTFMSKRPAGAAPSRTVVVGWLDLVRALTGVDLRRCPRCSHGRLHRRPLPHPRPRAPPGAAV